MEEEKKHFVCDGLIPKPVRAVTQKLLDRYPVSLEICFAGHQMMQKILVFLISCEIITAFNKSPMKGIWRYKSSAIPFSNYD